jgi:hypothetical protein
MTDLNPVGIEEWEFQRSLIRTQNARKIGAVLDALEPLVLGYTDKGVSPGHVKVYLQALRELGQLFQVHEPPRAVEAAKDAGLALETQRAVVLAELETLASRAADRLGKPGAARG